MKRFLLAIIPIALGSVVLTALAQDKAELDAAEKAGHDALDRFMTAWNAKDEEAWASTLNYPHVRIAGEAVRVYDTKQEFVDYMDFDAFAERTGWDHSAWDWKKVIQKTHNKVHIAVQFSRYDKNDKKISTYESLYIVTLKDGKWGTQARSSFAP